MHPQNVRPCVNSRVRALEPSSLWVRTLSLTQHFYGCLLPFSIGSGSEQDLVVKEKEVGAAPTDGCEGSWRKAQHWGAFSRRGPRSPLSAGRDGPRLGPQIPCVCARACVLCWWG